MRRSARVAAAPWTVAAPSSRIAAAAASRVAPVVTTSSTTRTTAPERRRPRPNTRGPDRRPTPSRSVWAGPRPRTSSRRHGRLARAAIARARSSAWSKPRRRWAGRDAGAQVMTSTSGSNGTSRSAITVTAPVRRPYLRPRTRSAGAPSWVQSVVRELSVTPPNLGSGSDSEPQVAGSSPSASTPTRFAGTMPCSYIHPNMSRHVSTIGRNATPVRSTVAESSPGLESKM